MEVSKEEGWEESHTPSKNLSVGLFVYHAHHLLPTIKVGTPNRALFPILSFVGAILLIKACCPRDHYAHLLLQFYMQVLKVLKTFSQPIFPAIFNPLFYPFFPLHPKKRNLKMAGGGGENKKVQIKYLWPLFYKGLFCRRFLRILKCKIKSCFLRDSGCLVAQHFWKL